MEHTMIHKTSIVNKRAEIGSGVEIGPYTIIGKDVKIGNLFFYIGYISFHL